ncbi:hypothetical protein ABFS82_10G150000 [Erythranthe guttata]|nr:PREDICTED: Werner syndrome ATP-dependent helicase homolog [Erythranthe guttata]|eukprot:XP_012828058.1 PREDICTED: Werner syndrome ATP-dependent helicase homolog [Erythranthe guttata]
MTMNVKIEEFKLPFDTHKLYNVIIDNNDVIETLVTHDPTMVCMWINNTEILNRPRLHRLLVGLDTEWRSIVVEGRVQTVSVLQLCVGKSCLVYQILHAEEIPHELVSFLENPDYTFVGIGVDKDVEKLLGDYNLKVTKVRDLRTWAAKELEAKELRYAGLKTLVNLVVGKDMEKPKRITMSRWDNRVLSRGQVSYACLDAYFSFEIARLLSSWY